MKNTQVLLIHKALDLLALNQHKHLPSLRKKDLEQLRLDLNLIAETKKAFDSLCFSTAGN